LQFVRAKGGSVAEALDVRVGHPGRR
jgi:hypothetical protein